MGCNNLAPLRRVNRSISVIIAFSLLPAFFLRAENPVVKSGDGASTIDLANLQSRFRAVADRVAPSVVAISAAITSSDSDDLVRAETMNGPKLEAILEKTTRTVGTGFVIDRDGYILTNEHVIADAGQIWITTDDRKVYPAIVVGSDPRADLAVLKVPARDLPPVRFAPAGTVQRGMWTIALGNPYGLAAAGEMSMSVGVVSATDRSLPKLANQEKRFYANLIQTTAEINPGNSGGPLFDIEGQVIGISTAVILPQKATNGIGFALPVTPGLLQQARDLQEGKETIYGYLGVMVTTPTVRQRRSAGISDESGVMIESIEKSSPGDGILEPADIVTRLDDQPVVESDQFVRLIGQSSVVQPTRLVVYRDAKPLNLSIQLRRRELPSVTINRDNQRIRWRGMLLGPIPANWDFGMVKRPEHGLMVLGVDATSPMLKDGIRSGAIITAVAGKPVRAVTDLQEILNDTPAEKCALEMAPQPKDAVVSGQ